MKINKISIFIASILLIAATGFILWSFNKTKKNELAKMRDAFSPSVLKSNQSEFATAIEERKFTRALELLEAEKNVQKIKAFFQSGIAFFDLNPSFSLSSDEAKELTAGLFKFLSKNEDMQGAEVAKTKVFAGRLLSKLFRYVSDAKTEEAMIHLIGGKDLDLSLKMTFIEALSNFRSLSSAGLEVIKRTAKSKDPGTSQSGLMVGEQIRDPKAEEIFVQWVRENQSSFVPSVQALAFRISATHAKDDLTRDQLLKLALSKNDENWRDAILSVLANETKNKKYRNEIEKIRKVTQSMVLRQRADVLLKQMDENR